MICQARCDIINNTAMSHNKDIINLKKINMKRVFSIFAVVMLLMFGGTGLAANEPVEIRVRLDGNSANIGVIIAEDEKLLPIRDVAELLGGTVRWDGDLRQISVRRGNVNAVLTIGNSAAVINNRTVELGRPVQIINGRTMVSLRSVSDILGIGVGFANNTVILTTRPAQRIPVLVYHHILPDAQNRNFRENAFVVSEENFRAQMRYLHDNGFYTPTHSELEDFLYNGLNLPQNSVMIHFDDGYYSNFVYAYPILQAFGLRATIFFITHTIEDLGDTQPLINHDALTFTAAKTIAGTEDVFEIASHTHNMHDPLPGSTRTILASETKENILQDTLRSFDFVTNHIAFAYPHGQFNQTVIAALREAGITMAFTINSGYVTRNSNPFELARFTIFRDTSLSRFRNIVRGNVR